MVDCLRVKPLPQRAQLFLIFILKTVIYEYYSVFRYCISGVCKAFICFEIEINLVHLICEAGFLGWLVDGVVLVELVVLLHGLLLF